MCGDGTPVTGTVAHVAAAVPGVVSSTASTPADDVLAPPTAKVYPPNETRSSAENPASTLLKGRQICRVGIDTKNESHSVRDAMAFVPAL